MFLKIQIKKVAMILCCGLSAGPALAYSLWVPQGKTLRRQVATHVVVVGYSHGQGNQFVQAAVGRLKRYVEMFPDRNFVLYQPQSESFKLAGLTKALTVNKELLGATLVQELLTYSSIMTIDFFSHSSVHQGVGLEVDGVNRPDQSFYAVGLPGNPVKAYRLGTPGLDKLRKVLHPDAWVSLNGCNAAWIQAPALSKILGRPVLAALTGTDFQRLHADGEYYFNNSGSYPTDKGWAKQNTIAYDGRPDCAEGACLRMKPQPSGYKGYWGNYQNVGGLGFYKFFCNYENASATCYKTMARYLSSVMSQRPLTVRSQRADFVETLLDMVCPISPTKASRADCVNTIIAKLKAGEESYFPYPGIPADCSLSGCKIKGVKCEFRSSGVGIPGTCKFTVDADADGRKTLIREVKNYLRGLDELGIR